MKLELSNEEMLTLERLMLLGLGVKMEDQQMCIKALHSLQGVSLDSIKTLLVSVHEMNKELKSG